MSENGDDKQQGGPANEEELATRQVQIQSKRFYIDVKENKRGRFIKLAEVGVGGRKSRIIMSMGTASEFQTRLGEFSEMNANLGPSHGGGAGGSGAGGSGAGNGDDSDGLLKSETIVRDRKRYYLDLKENQRGRFLRVSMVMPRGARAQIAIPAQGLIEFKDHLAELLGQFGSTDESKDNVELPESKSLRADNKTFYFDCGSNPRGVFLRISEVRSNRYRTSITVPEKYWDQFRKSISDFVDKSSSTGVASTSQAGSTITTTTAAGAIKAENDQTAK